VIRSEARAGRLGPGLARPFEVGLFTELLELKVSVPLHVPLPFICRFRIIFIINLRWSLVMW
jgi:hypothetical protein